MVRVSKHASRRLKERCGLNKKSVQRMADIAFTNGMKQEDATGQLNRWMASLYCANMDANNIRIYGNYVYIFCGITLVTVLHVPHRLKNHVNEQIFRQNCVPCPACRAAADGLPLLRRKTRHYTERKGHGI